MFVAPKFVWDKHKDINEPSQKAILVYDAGQEDLILQVKYDGPLREFGWLIPVPSLPTVQKGSMNCFYELSQYTQRQNQMTGIARASYGSESASDHSAAEEKEPPVKVVEIKTVGAYQTAVLSATDAGALARWLAANRFDIPAKAPEVIDFYVQRHWYFVAVKINLVAAVSYGTAQALAGGELNPLQIHFASDGCIYPLKISSANGLPSEVQIYVLSREPLLEKTMLEKKLPAIYTNDLAHAAQRVQAENNMQAQLAERMSAAGHGPGLRRRDDDDLMTLLSKPMAEPGELLPFDPVTEAEIPKCIRAIPRLAGKSWWLSKQTWTFKPEEMNDLDFEPAPPVFAAELGTKYGYYAATCLASLQKDAIPTLVTAISSPNTSVRLDAISCFDHGFNEDADPRLTAAAQTWLNDSEPEVRLAAAEVLFAAWNPQNAGRLVALLRDPDPDVRLSVARQLQNPSLRRDVEKQLPVIREMLNDNDPNIRASGIRMLILLQQPVTREQLLSCFAIPDQSVIGLAISQFQEFGKRGSRRYELSDQEAVPLLHNSEPFARLVGLVVLVGNATPESVELALPLLKDTDLMVRNRAELSLRRLTGQTFTADQTDEWNRWWSANQAHFVVPPPPQR